MDQLLVLVGGRSSRVHQLIPHPLELAQKRLVGLAAKAPQHRRLIQADGGKSCGVDVAVPDPFIVGQQDTASGRFYLVHSPYIRRRLHTQELHRIPSKFLAHA